MRPPILLLLNPWVLAASAGVAAYSFYKNNQSQRKRLRDAKDELDEQQRTIDRLRAEVARAHREPPAATT